MDNYSSLFTMGLRLSERASPVSSSRSPRSPRSSFFSKFRKSSLPTKALSKPSEMYSRGEGRFYPNNDPPPQFTNPFGDSPTTATTNNELPSFLPLELAADGTSIARHSSKFLSPLDMTSATAYSAPYVSHATTAEGSISDSLLDRRQRHSDSMAPLSLPPPRRPSRDSLRTLPSPGPAPSAALPEIPSEREHARPLPPITIPSASLFPVSSSSYPQPPHSAPPISFAPSTDVSTFVSLSPLSPLSPPVSASRRTQQHSFFSFSSNTTTSVRTSRRRNAERSNALACLEGHSRVPGRIARNSRQQNFMSMSDDDDEADESDVGEDADVEEEEDDFTTLQPPPTPPRSAARTRASSLVLPASSPIGNVATIAEYRSPIDEEEDCVLPPAAISALRQTSSSKPSRSRSRRSTLESWFPPLANFIDFKDEELSGWRGVVEIVNGL